MCYERAGERVCVMRERGRGGQGAARGKSRDLVLSYRSRVMIDIGNHNTVIRNKCHASRLSVGVRRIETCPESHTLQGKPKQTQLQPHTHTHTHTHTLQP